VPNVQDRDALYYPYIHIRDINWLKGTLLCFPQVRRIVPSDFPLNDSAEVRKFLRLRGARGEPLLTQEYTDYHFASSPLQATQEQLLTLLKSNERRIKSQYSQEAAVRDLGEKYDSFEMHAGKMLAPLHDYLMREGIGWYSRRTRTQNADTRWVTLHPRLGEAIMSLIAIAIAQEAKLDIVTSSGRLHHALAVQDENEVLDTLLGRRTAKTEASVDEKVDELAEIVMTTCFDLNRLDAEQIAELIKEGKDLRSFKNALVPFAEELPDLADPTQREKRFKAKAQEVIEAWQSYKKSLPWFALDALDTAAGASVPSLALKAVGASHPVTIAAGAGFALFYLTYKGAKIWRDYRKNIGNPLNFLTRIEKAGASLVLPPSTSISDQ